MWEENGDFQLFSRPATKTLVFIMAPSHSFCFYHGSKGSSSGQVVFCPGLGTLGASLVEMKL